MWNAVDFSVKDDNYLFVFLKILNECAFTLAGSEFLVTSDVYAVLCNVLKKLTDSSLQR